MNSLLSRFKIFYAVALAFGCSAVAARAQLMVTYAEAPGDYNSLLQNTIIFNFNDLAVGANDNVKWTSNGKEIGTFDHLYIKSIDWYGGAADTPAAPTGSKYSLQGVGAGASSSSVLTVSNLSFTTPVAYFGFWWSAGDAKNMLRFYNGTTLVAQFTTATLLDRIAGDSAYKGNPRNRAWNNTQSYVFLNFFAMDGATWDRIEFSNTATGTAFESDNYTERVAPYNPATDGPMPGVPLAIVNGTIVTPVPEPTTAALGLLAVPILLRRKRSA